MKMKGYLSRKKNNKRVKWKLLIIEVGENVKIAEAKIASRNNIRHE